MQKLVFALAVSLALTLGMLIGKPLFASASPQQTSAQTKIADLSSRIALLERKIRLQTALDLNYNSQFLDLQNRKLTVNESPGGTTIISPLSWGTAFGGVCLNGAAVGTTFHLDYPAEIGTVTADGEVHAFNPSTSRSVLLTSNVLCVSLG